MATKIQPSESIYYLTLDEIMRRLEISLMTLNNWRKGSSKIKPLPVNYYELGKSKRIFVDEREFVEWLKENRPALVEKWSRHERHERKVAA